MDKSPDAYRTISEVAEALKLPQHVLRFWETRFPQIKPMKRGGGRRFYSPNDIELLRAIRTLLYGDGYTIKGVQRILREQGPRAVASLALSGIVEAPAQQIPAAEAQQMTAMPDSGHGKPDETNCDFDAEGAMIFADAAPSQPIETAAPRPCTQAPPGLDGEAVREAVIDRLQALLFELSECERILAAARN